MRRRTRWTAGIALTGAAAAVAVAAGTLAGVPAHSAVAAPASTAPKTTDAVATVHSVQARLTALDADADRAGRAAEIADEAVVQHDTAANRAAADRAQDALAALADRQTPELTGLLSRLTALGVDPTPADAGTTATTAALVGKTRAVRAVSYARKQIGDPYSFAAAGPGRWDCSGLTMKSYKAVKVGIGGHSSTAQWRTAKREHRLHLYKNRKVGDLIFYGRPGAVYHVAIYAGHGKMIEAPYPGKRVRQVPVRSADRLPNVGRPA